MSGNEVGRRDVAQAGGALTAALRRRIVVAGAVGGFVEFYDFAVYGYVATDIARNFFPALTPGAGLLASFAAFGVAFLFRPLGGVIFGNMGDRVGRRTVLVLALLLTGASTLLVGVIPGATTIGVAAPIILVALRCLQGVGAGGEFGSAATFVVEQAPQHRRGFYAGLVGSGNLLGTASGSIVVLALSSLMPSADFQAWGWRIPFLIAGPLAAIGIYIRANLDDTPAFRIVAQKGIVRRIPVLTVLAQNFRSVLIAFGIALSYTAWIYFLVAFLVNFLQQRHVPAPETLLLNFIAFLVIIASGIILGAVMDRIGRRTVLILSFGLLVVGGLPIFALVITGQFWLILAGECIAAVALGGGGSALMVVSLEMFPTEVRASGIAVSYNIAQVLGGGLTPFVASALLVSTGAAISPFLYATGLALLSLVIIVLMARETLHVDLFASYDRTISLLPDGASPR